MTSGLRTEVFSYKAVEASLARVHLIPQKALGAFRGRLQHFQRLGMVPSSPGRGRRISYERSDIYLWAVALEFAEFGMDPQVIKLVLDAYWRDIQPQFLTPPAGSDRFLYFHPRLLAKGFPRELQQSPDNRDGAPFTITVRVLLDVSELDQIVRHPFAQPELQRLKSRYAMINLSQLQREIETALAA
jgi:hypothetical protein